MDHIEPAMIYLVTSRDQEFGIAPAVARLARWFR